MRGLFGDLGTMPLKDLVVYLGNKRASGVLSIEQEGIRKSISLHEGCVINAGSNRPDEYLGQFLINMGFITEDQFLRAYQEQQKTKVLLGRILVRDGRVKEGAVLNALNLKFRETLLSAYPWESGTFKFSSETPGFEGVETRVDLVDIAKEGEFRETAWQAIRAVFPSGRVKLGLRTENLAESPRPGTLDEKLFTLIEEGATVEEMALALHATEFFLYQRLYALYRLEAVHVLEEAALAAPAPLPQILGDELSARDIFDHAKLFFADGNYPDAATLARRAQELEASEERHLFLKEAEAALLAQLHTDLVESGGVPSLKVSPLQVKTLALSAPERYLLSRINGTRTVGDIIQVSPLHELEALRFFRGFLDHDLIGLSAAESDEAF